MHWILAQRSSIRRPGWQTSARKASMEPNGVTLALMVTSATHVEEFRGKVDELKAWITK
jgi:hypothetical protein